MSEDKSGKHRWRDPVVLVPIITAIIAAIPAYVLLIRPAIEDLQSLTSEPTPIPTTKPTPSVNPLSVTTDKKSYGFGDHVMVSGSVGKPVKGKTVRIDVYDPTMTVFEPRVIYKLRPTMKGNSPIDFPPKFSCGNGLTVPILLKQRTEIYPIMQRFQ